jgi:hypothetical protein
MRTSDTVYRELESVSGEIAMAKRMGEEVSYIYSLTIKRDELRNEYNAINSESSRDTPGQD